MSSAGASKPNEKPNVIAIIGNAGHGKDTVGNMLTEELRRKAVISQTFALADPLKKCFSDLFCVPLNLLYTEAGKNSHVESLGSKTMRELLIEFSAGAKRIWPEVWLSRAVWQVEEAQTGDMVDVSIITDVRTQKEKEYLELHCNTFFVKVVRDIDIYPPEVYLSDMEREVAAIHCPWEIVNDGSLDDLRQAVKIVSRDGIFPTFNWTWSDKL